MAPITLPEGISRYERQIQTIERLARSTVRARMRVVREFVSSLPSDVETTADLRRHHPVEYFAKEGPRWADATYNLTVTNLRLWLEFLGMEGVLGEDQAPWMLLKSRKNPKRARPKYHLYREDILAIAEGGAEYHIRDKYVILLSYAFARRQSEISDMRVGDIDLTPRPKMPYGYFTFRNIKSRSEHVGLPIIKEVREWVDEWLAEYEKLLGRKPKAHEPLFPALKPGPGAVRRGMPRPMVVRPGVRLSFSVAGEVWRRAQRNIGAYEKGRASHGARRGALVDLLPLVDNDIRAVKTYADHKSEATTEVYMDVSRDVMDLADKLNGRTPPPVVPEQDSPADDDAVVVNFTDRLARRRTAG